MSETVTLRTHLEKRAQSMAVSESRTFPSVRRPRLEFPCRVSRTSHESHPVPRAASPYYRSTREVGAVLPNQAIPVLGKPDAIGMELGVLQDSTVSTARAGIQFS